MAGSIYLRIIDFHMKVKILLTWQKDVQFVNKCVYLCAIVLWHTGCLMHGCRCWWCRTQRLLKLCWWRNASLRLPTAGWGTLFFPLLSLFNVVCPVLWWRNTCRKCCVCDSSNCKTIERQCRDTCSIIVHIIKDFPPLQWCKNNKNEKSIMFNYIFCTFPNLLQIWVCS